MASVGASRPRPVENCEEAHRNLRILCLAKWYTARRGDPMCTDTHEHRIWFRGNLFNVDCTGWKSVSAPENVSFVERIKKEQLPDEFEAPGLYNVMVRGLPFGRELGPDHMAPCELEEESDEELDLDSDDESYDDIKDVEDEGIFLDNDDDFKDVEDEGKEKNGNKDKMDTKVDHNEDDM